MTAGLESYAQQNEKQRERKKEVGMIPKKVKTCNVNSIYSLISGYLHKQQQKCSSKKKTIYWAIKAEILEILEILTDYPRLVIQLSSKIEKTRKEKESPKNNKA